MKTLRLPFQVSIIIGMMIAAFAATSAHARLGDTLSQIKKHRGSPSGNPNKKTAMWLFEGDDGQLVYAVKFDAEGRSMAETLKPGLTGRRLHSEFVLDFIKAQREVLEGSTTTREPKVGEKFTFAGQALSVAENEYVIVDEPRGFLLVWVRGSVPSVTVLTPAALR